MTIKYGLCLEPGAATYVQPLSPKPVTGQQETLGVSHHEPDSRGDSPEHTDGFLSLFLPLPPVIGLRSNCVC